MTVWLEEEHCDHHGILLWEAAHLAFAVKSGISADWGDLHQRSTCSSALQRLTLTVSQLHSEPRSHLSEQAALALRGRELQMVAGFYHCISFTNRCTLYVLLFFKWGKFFKFGLDIEILNTLNGMTMFWLTNYQLNERFDSKIIIYTDMYQSMYVYSSYSSLCAGGVMVHIVQLGTIQWCQYSAAKYKKKKENRNAREMSLIFIFFL